jgi:hypothetical protein
MVENAVIPPTRPLSLDILANLIGFLLDASDMKTLNSIRLTSRTVCRLVEKQVIFAHNYYTFDDNDDRDHRRFAKLLALVLQNPSAHLPLLHTLDIPGVNKWHQIDRSVTAHPCICVSLLVDVLQHSRSLQDISIWSSEPLLMADARIADALSASSSLRALSVHDGFGPQTMRMFRQMGPGLRELGLSPCDSDDWDMGQAPLMTAFRGLQSSLEKLELRYDRNPLDIGVNNAELVWPHVHSLELDSDVEASAPELAHAFPNLRNLRIAEEVEEEEDVTASRIRCRSMGLCWTYLDDVHMPISVLCAFALTARVRKLVVTGELEDKSYAQYLLEDLPAIRPASLTLRLLMASDRSDDETMDDEAAAGLGNQVPVGRGRGIEVSLAGSVLNALSRVKVLVLTISGKSAKQTLQADDQYVVSFFSQNLTCILIHLSSQNTIASTLNMPVLEYLRLHLYHPSPRWPLDNQLSKQMHDRGKRGLVETLADSARSLRHVFISGWSRSYEFGSGHLWDVLRPTKMTLELREMPWRGIYKLIPRFEC